MNPLTVLALAAIGFAMLYSVWRHALLSLTLSLAILVVFFLDYVSQFLVLGAPVGFELAWIQAPNLPVPYYSPAWTFATTMFVHAGYVHLLFNLLGFVLITPILEERIGTLRWALLFFLGGWFGQLIFWIVHAGGTFAVVGASGGLLAILGAFARLYPRERVTIFLPLPGMPTVPVIWLAIGYLLLSFVLVAGVRGPVAHEAHIGGLVFGLVVAPAVMRIRLPTARQASPVAAASLEPLATTYELRDILEQLKAADVAEIRAAWLDKFAAKVTCPSCGGPLRRRRSVLASRCGWRLRLE